MSAHDSLSRRSFLAWSAAAPLAFASPAGKNLPIGLELFSVRDQLAKDLPGTVTAVAKMGYQVVEFFAPYFSWTAEQAKETRKLLDDLGIRCLSTHNGPNAFTAEGLQKAIDLNSTLGVKYVVLASAGRVNGLDGWKQLGDHLTLAMEKLRPAGLRAGYHNHQAEFTPVDGKRPIEALAASTPKDFMLQLDVGTCVEMKSDPVAWIEANPGRINSLHLKDWAPGADKGYRVLFGEGEAPWQKIFAAAESVGGAEYYLIEQEGSRFPALETAERCLANYKRMRA
ncbi:MAG TPA: sugar phosphate isomerase/epimerase family protein [Candidatus Sulfopaludibacter sp.]|nr:sugar phosphate isomerase/epimerase family protein [Candidatus Sulfopaludibacter sp.]